jgi:uncharacterized protein
MILKEILRYPVKGLSPERLDYVQVSPGRPLPHDRQFAFARGDAFTDGAVRWIRRGNFLQCADDDVLAELDARCDAEAGTLTLSRRGQPILTASLREPDGRAALEDYFAALVEPDGRGRPRAVEIGRDSSPGADGQSFADTPPPHVSIINLATVRAIGDLVGADLHPLRFRGNLLIEAEPWVEFDWVGRRITIGDVAFDVRERIGRCVATNLNPETAERDQNLPLALRKAYGHHDCGVYVVVASAGEIRSGDRISASA